MLNMKAIINDVPTRSKSGNLKFQAYGVFDSGILTLQEC